MLRLARRHLRSVTVYESGSKVQAREHGYDGLGANSFSIHHSQIADNIRMSLLKKDITRRDGAQDKREREEGWFYTMHGSLV